MAQILIEDGGRYANPRGSSGHCLQPEKGREGRVEVIVERDTRKSFMLS
jgi:hypothetical protein